MLGVLIRSANEGPQHTFGENYDKYQYIMLEALWLKCPDDGLT